MRFIPKASKVKVTFYKGITIPDIIIALIELTFVAVALSSNFAFKWYLAGIVACLITPLFLTIGEKRLYTHIAYLFRYLFSRKRLKGENVRTVLPYKEVKDGIVYNKDGSIFSAIEIKPINFFLRDEEKQNEIIDFYYARVLNHVNPDEEWILKKVETPLVLDDKLQSELKRLEKLSLMKERGELTEEEYKARCDIIQSRFSEIDAMNSNGSKIPRYYLCLVGISEKEVLQNLDYAVSVLESIGIQSHRLSEKELYLLLRTEHPKEFDPREEISSVYGPDDVRFGISSSKEDGISCSHVAITRYPMAVNNAWAECLFSLENTKVTMRMKPLEKDKAVKRIDSAILELDTMASDKESKYQETGAHLESLRDLMQDIQQNNETLFDAEIVLTVYDEPKSSRNKKYVLSVLKEAGFGYSELIGRQEDGYVSSFASKTDTLRIEHGIQTSSLAAAFPFVADEIDDLEGILMGGNTMLAFVDFFKRDASHVNSNLVVIGQSGSGKSYSTKTLLSNLASAGAKVYVLDPEDEYGELAKNLGGSLLDASDGSKGRINPFQVMTTLEDEGGQSNSFYAHLQFLEEFFRVVLNGISMDSLEVLNKLVEETYASKGIGPLSDFSKLKAEDYPTFEDLCLLVDKKISGAKDDYEKNCLRTLSNWILRFKKGYRDSGLWNGYTSFSPKENFVCFSFQRLLANHNEVTANAQMLLLLCWLENEVIRNRDYNRVNKADRKIVVAIDEAHLFIDEKYPIALDFMYQLAKRIRKYDGMLIVITQNVRDFMGTSEVSKKSSALISVSQYSMIFALSPNDLNELIKLYQNSGGFNDEEKDSILHNPRGFCFFIRSVNERGNLSIEANDYQKSLFE